MKRLDNHIESLVGGGAGSGVQQVEVNPEDEKRTLDSKCQLTGVLTP